MRYDKIIRRIKYLYWILVQPIGVRTHVYGIRSVVQSVLRLTVARQRTLEHFQTSTKDRIHHDDDAVAGALVFTGKCADNVMSVIYIYFNKFWT